MYELQSLKEFVNNPMGKGVSILPNKDLILEDLKRRYKLFETKGKKILMDVYHEKRKDIFYFHIKVPSETIRVNTYDVILEFTPSKKSLLGKPLTIDNYSVRFFSNCPSFVFTYANIMIKNDLIVKFLRKKYSKDVIKKDAKIHNPTGVIMYEKSLMFAALHILEDERLSNRGYLATIAKPFYEEILSRKVRSESDILDEIKKENIRTGKEKKAQKETLTKEVKDMSKHVKKKAGIDNSTIKTIIPKKSTSMSSSSSTSKGSSSSIKKISPKKSTKRK